MSYFCQTFSKFLYGFEVTEENNIIDFNEGSGQLHAAIEAGNYSFGDYSVAVAAALNTTGLNTYTVSVDRATRKITITSSASVSFLFATGDNATFASAAAMLGFSATDHSSVTTLTSDTAMGSVYSPQFMLQQYVPSVNQQGALSSSKNVSASGRVQVQRFGDLLEMECEICYATDIFQPSSGPIRNNPTGVSDLRAFMAALCRQCPIEFYVDENDNNTFETLLLEKTSASKDGTSFKLTEMAQWKLRGYLTTGLLTFRVVT